MDRLTRLLRFIEYISKWSGWFASLLLFGAICVVITEVIMRYFFHDPPIWGFELSQFFFGSSILLGGAYALLHKGHVNMDVIYNRFSPRGKAIIDICTFVIFLVFIASLLYWSWHAFSVSFKWMEKSDSSWAPLLWPSKLTVVLGAFFVLLQGLKKLFDDISVAIGRKQP